MDELDGEGWRRGKQFICRDATRKVPFIKKARVERIEFQQEGDLFVYVYMLLGNTNLYLSIPYVDEYHTIIFGLPGQLTADINAGAVQSKRRMGGIKARISLGLHLVVPFKRCTTGTTDKFGPTLKYYQIEMVSKFCDWFEYHLTTAIKLRCYQIEVVSKFCDLFEYHLTTAIKLRCCWRLKRLSRIPGHPIPLYHSWYQWYLGTTITGLSTIIPQLPGIEKTYKNSGPPNTAVPQLVYHKFQATQYRCTTVITSGIWVPQLPEIEPVSAAVPQILQVVFQYHNYWKLKDLAKFMAPQHCCTTDTTSGGL
ncbi:hypothetical protein GGX14DRAFT_403555 [Mycena pura]|uniref:Uncharacterized protein n=1 Tax=Mycena pura TaxID=153505 RepID=A0AAD6UVS5_9AGAR|nr:hypothetical protein GGX14DRAFT_403555 [Mycena pura]